MRTFWKAEGFSRSHGGQLSLINYQSFFSGDAKNGFAQSCNDNGLATLVTLLLDLFFICGGHDSNGVLSMRGSGRPEGLPLALVLTFLVYMYYDTSSLVIVVYTR